jgi:hypothetical protein
MRSCLRGTSTRLRKLSSCAGAKAGPINPYDAAAKKLATPVQEFRDRRRRRERRSEGRGACGLR